MNNKLFKGTNGMSPEDLKSLEEGLKVAKSAISGLEGAAYAKDVTSAVPEGESAYYTGVKNLMKGVSLIEGVVGVFAETSLPLSIGLSALQDWYSTVDTMIEIGNAKKIEKQFTITARVKGKKGADSRSIIVPVEGYEMVLAEETFIPEI